MVVGEVASRTDVVVIGGGPGGYVAALRCAELGRDVVLVERERVGGVCLNAGCIPSRALLRAAELAGSEDDARRWGVLLTAKVDMGAVQAAVADVSRRLSSGVETLLRHAGVRVIRGTARFSNGRRVAIASAGDEQVEHLQFDEAIVATGSSPLGLPSLPLDDRGVLSPSAAIALDRVPETMTVIGAGSSGIEVSTAFAKLGSRVVLVEQQDRVLPHLPAALTAPVARRLSDLGVDVHLSAAGEDLTAEAEVVVLAVGRTPNTGDLGLDRVGVELTPSGRIAVDRSRRAAAHVLAVGDVTPGLMLAHKAMAEAEVAARTAAGQVAAFDPACIPEVIYGDPEIATVGFTAEQATAAGLDVRASSFPLAASGRAATLGWSSGLVEVVAQAADGLLVGLHLVGPGVGELAGEAALAIEMGATAEDLALTIHPHPTLSEAVVEAAFGVLGRPLHAGRRRIGR